MNDPATREVQLSRADLFRAVGEGVVSPVNADALIAWVQRSTGAAGALPVERANGLHWISVLYYGGALLMIAACGWLLGDQWEELGSLGVLVTSLIYATAAMWMGTILRRRGWLIAGGLLITVGVCLTRS